MFKYYLFLQIIVVLYALFASYFAGVMVRLILTLTPCVCVLSAIAFSSLFELYLKDDDNPKSDQSSRNDNLYDEVCFGGYMVLISNNGYLTGNGDLFKNFRLEKFARCHTSRTRMKIRLEAISELLCSLQYYLFYFYLLFIAPG